MTRLFSSLKAAELSTLSNLAYGAVTHAPVYGWSVVPDLTGANPGGLAFTTYQRGNEYVIAFRGTDSIRDIGADASFVFKQWDSQFEMAAAFIKKLREEVPEGVIQVTGHSLGGGIAQIVAKMFNLSGASFEAPGANGVTNTLGYLEAKTKYARDIPEGQGSPGFVNYLSKGSLISSVGTHVGETIVLSPAGNSFSAGTIMPTFALFFVGPIKIASLGALFLDNVSRTHPIAGMERTMWVSALLEEELSLDRGKLVEVRTRRADVPELLALGGNPNDEVHVFRDRFTNAVRATLAKEGQGFVLRSADMTEKVTLTQAADGAFDCKIERIAMPTTTCRLRFDPSGVPRVEIDSNDDGLPEQIVESGRDASGMVFQKVSFIDERGQLQASEEVHLSDDGLHSLVYVDRDGDGRIEERRQQRIDGEDHQLTSVAQLDADGQVQSELRLRSDTHRELTVYELIVNGQTENLGFISQPVDDELIARLSAQLGGKPDLRSLYAFDGELTDTLTLNTRHRQALAHEMAVRLMDLQLEAFVDSAGTALLGSLPALLPSERLTGRISAELAQFQDRSELDVRINLDNELLLVSSDRMVLIRADGSVRRQSVGERNTQWVENLDAEGFLVSSVRTGAPAGAGAGRGILYDFHYRDGASARIEVALAVGLGEFASVTLRSGELMLDASFANGQLAGIQHAMIDGRELSPGALQGLTLQLGDLSADELLSAFQSRRDAAGAAGSADAAEDVARPAQALSTALEDVRSELVAATDHLGKPIYLSRTEQQLQSLTHGVSSLIDGLTLLNALRSGQPLPIAASGLRLAAGLDMLDGSRDLPLLGGAASAATAVLSIYGLAQALKEGDGVAAISSAAYATVGLAETAAFLQKAGLIDTLPSSLSAAGNSLNAALPYINLVNSIAHGDKTGVAVAVTDLVLMKTVATYTVPVVGWAYAIFSLVDALFTEIPDPWGNARFVWRHGTLAIDSAGETGGEEAVRNVMQTVLQSMNSLIERAREQNPGSQLGIIANRMPGLIMAMDGYRFTDIDGLSGAERNPSLRFDTSGRPYNAEPGSPESFIGLVEAILRSALSREAIAPLWEVRTAALQTAAGDPKAGLREEERAGSDGLLAAPVTGPDQVFRPVVLDLEGDGIERLSRAPGVLFDVDDSGFQKRTGWIADDDAFLVLDRNYNGVIDGGREMFSNALVALARRGLAGMAWTDASYDGRITAADPVWEELRLWQDRDGDAIQDEGELLRLAELGITELNYAMSTYTRDGRQYQLASPNLDADAHGLRVNMVPQGILIEASEDRRLSLLVSRIDDKTAVEPGRDGAEGIEDIELLIDSRQLLENDLLGGFEGRALQMESLLNFRHGSGYLDANGIVHFQPAADHAGEGAGFDYIAIASNGQTGRGSVDIRLAPVNDAPTLGGVEQDSRPIYGYGPLGFDPETGVPDGSAVPLYEPFTNSDSWGRPVLRDTPVAQEATGTGRVIGADIDDAAGSLFYELLGQPQYGAVSLDATGHYVYTSWKSPGTPSDRVLLDGQYAAWKDGVLYNRDNLSGPAVYPTSDAFQVRITDPHGASSVVTVSVPHYGPYLPPTPPGGGGKKPIAIDLDGDGFEFVNVDDSDIFYDVTGDGWKRRTAWVGRDDGLLAIDLDGDGKIDRPDEIAFANRVEGAQTDLEGMAAFDANGDGRFDADDRDWSRFGIWQDANQNGETDAGEFNALEALGVQAVLLDSDGRFQVINGQTIHGIGRLVKADGSELALADVTLAFSQQRQLPDGASTLPDSPFSPAGTPISGSDGNELMPGRHGSDVIHAHGGDDLVLDDAGNDLVFAGEGDDLIFTGADHDVVDAGAGNDYLHLGLGDDIAFGGDGDDTLFAGPGNDIAFGGQGKDLLAGEAGNDVLSGDEGDDQLYGGDGSDVLFGRDGDDQLFGMNGDDLLDGGDGSDLLDGGPGADRLIGGAGDDIYRVDDVADSVVEADDAGQDSGGHDTVHAALDGYRLGTYLEDLVLSDLRQAASPRLAYGNALANHIIGNRERNTLFGEDGDDLLDGGVEADLMIGGQGDDTYRVDNEGDRVIEREGEGMDTVQSSVSYTLPETVEHLVLTGTRPVAATGNALDNQLTGNAGANRIDGGAGADTMAGGAGDDVYDVDHRDDRVIEQLGEGTDTVIASIDWRLDAHIENLILSGSDDLQAFGNSLANLLRGNRGSNLLVAGGGDDLLIGAGGDDVLDGGDGNDTYLYQRGDGLDHISDTSGDDRLRLGEGISADQLSVRVVDTRSGLQAQLRFIDVHGNEDSQAGIDVAMTSNDCDPVVPVIETVEFADGRVLDFGQLLTRTRVRNAGARDATITGDRSDDIIYGNSRDNRLDGGVGNDALFGENGSDSLLGGGGNDFLAGGRKDDIIDTGSGHNLIAFNRNDGRDTLRTHAGAVNTLSLGQGITLTDLSLQRVGQDLLIDIGKKDGVILKDWYADVAHRNLQTLQLVDEAKGKAAPRVTQIAFAAVADQFEAAVGGRANSSWQLTADKLAAHLQTGTTAMGGELAIAYAQHGSFKLSSTAIAGAMYQLDPGLASQRLVSVEGHHA